MSEQADNLKTVAQIRKAILPLVGLLKAEADAELNKRLTAIETVVNELAKRETTVQVKAPDVNVTVETPQAITDALTKLQKNSEAQPAAPEALTYEPHDQVKKGTFQYSGFVRADGEWYIQRVAKGEQRYAKGTGNYSDAWASAGDQKYGYLDGSR